jgi:Response regulator containing CheY-like receiver domain and AraC-type DNA-binding domain
MLLIFLLVFAFVHQSVTNKLTAEEAERTQRYMERGSRAISESLLSAYMTMGKLSSYATVQSLTTAQVKQPIHFAQMLKLQNELKSLFSSEEWLLTVQVFINTDRGIAIFPDGVLHDVRTAFEDGRFGVDALSYDAFCVLLQTAYNRKLQIQQCAGTFSFHTSTQRDGAATTAVCFVHKLTLPSSRAEAYVIAWLDVEALRTAIAGDAQVSGLFSLFADEALLYSTQPGMDSISPYVARQHIPTLNATLLSVQIQGTPLYGMLALPDEVVAEKTAALTSLLYILLSVFLALSLLLFVVFLITVLWPLDKLVKRMKPSEGNIFSEIHRHLDDADAQALNSALRQLLFGFTENKEVQSVIRLLSSREDGGLWYVWIVSGPFRDSQAWLPVREMMAKQYRQINIISVDASNLAGILCLNAQDAARLPELCTQTLAELRARYDGVGTFAMGLCREGTRLIDLNVAFVKAQRALRIAVWWQSPDAVCVDDWGVAAEYRLPYADLEQLYHLIIQGNGVSAVDCLERYAARLFGSQYRDRKPPVLYKQFQHDILGVLLRVSAHMDIFTLMHPFMDEEEHSDFTNFITQIREVVRYTAEQMALQEEGQSQTLSGQMVEYLQAKYANMDMSLSLLAEQFHISEQHCSAFFKDKIGTNFSTYLEALRLAHAKQLLSDGFAVREVSLKVGYASANTFTKAFKRRIGLTPSDWLDVQRRGER